MTTHETSSESARRAWLAALLLRRPEGLLTRFAAGVARLRALPRGFRRRLQRKTAATAVGAALILGMAGGAFFAPTAHAATINVDDGIVAIDAGDGFCSLREAILNANGNNQSSSNPGECESGAPGPDIITLPANGNFTLNDYHNHAYYSDTGLPVISSEIIIEGNGSIIARDDGHTTPEFRIMLIKGGGDLTLNAVTISGGHTGGVGGGIVLTDGKLTINNSTISDNYGGYDGGGIYSEGNSTLIINGSTISGNHTGTDGGGIYTSDYTVATITNSTFSYNTADNYGGGIYLDDGQLTLNHVTITANSAADAGGGIYVFGSDAVLTLNRSLVSGNIAPYFSEIFVLQFTLSPNNHNVFGHEGLTNGEAFRGLTAGATDVTATSDGTNPTALADILDTTLADNGGPTLTHNLVPGSPALDIAPDADCAADPTNGLDQRGETRPFDVAGEGNDAPDANTCDAGAVEYRPADPVIFMSAKTSGVTTDGLAFDNSDILKWDGTEWSKFFDGTDAHLDPSNKPKHNINAFWIDDNDDIIMSFAQNSRKVVGIGPNVDGMDLVKWDGSGFSLWFDGSDVGLTKKTPEKIDALHVLPGDQSPIGGSCINYLLVSTQGPGAVPAYGGGQIKFGGEDILGFCATNLGEATAGFWHLVLDGSAVGLPKNAIDSISADGDGNVIYFTTTKVINVDDASGGHSMVFAYDTTTDDFSGPLFKAADYGLAQKVDGLQMN